MVTQRVKATRTVTHPHNSVTLAHTQLRQVLEAAMNLPGIRSGTGPGGKEIKLSDRANIYLHLAIAHSELNHGPEAAKIIQDATREFKGTAQQVRMCACLHVCGCLNHGSGQTWLRSGLERMSIASDHKPTTPSPLPTRQHAPFPSIKHIRKVVSDEKMCDSFLSHPCIHGLIQFEQ